MIETLGSRAAIAPGAVGMLAVATPHGAGQQAGAGPGMVRSGAGISAGGVRMERLFTGAVAVIAMAGAALAQKPAAPEPAGSEGQRPADAFVYVDDYEVRQEAMMPLALLESFVPVPRADPATLTIAEQAAATSAIADFFTATNTLRIDGAPVEPDEVRVVFLDRTVTDPAGEIVPRPLAAAEAFVGYSLVYTRAAPPRTVALEWRAFSPMVTTVRGSVLAGREARRAALTAAQPRLEWTRRHAVAAAAIAPVTTKAPATWSARGERPPFTADDAAAITGTLLRQIYTAFRHREERAIHDALAVSVADDLLERAYLDIRNGLLVAGAGGARATVDEVTIGEGRPRTPLRPGTTRFDYEAIWQVRGRVEHWGHVHERTNRHRAVLTVAVRDGAWRLVAMEMTEKERVETRAAPRELPPVP